MSPLTAGLIVMGIIVSLFLIALLALFIAKKNNQRHHNSSFKGGDDDAGFSRSFTRRFDEEVGTSDFDEFS